jgi:hypothetical protein
MSLLFLALKDFQNQKELINMLVIWILICFQIFHLEKNKSEVPLKAQLTRLILPNF